MDLIDALGTLFTSETKNFLELAREVGLDPKRDFRGADLSNLDLTAADLAGADLRGTNLSSTILVRADLRNADLRGARLIRADLREAQLDRSNLARADASQATLRNASLSGANCDKLKLDSADLTGASVLMIRGNSPPPEIRRQDQLRRPGFSKKRLGHLVGMVTRTRNQWGKRYSDREEYQALTKVLAQATQAIEQGDSRSIRAAETRLWHTFRTARRAFMSNQGQRIST
jgi:hypothetical protein